MKVLFVTSHGPLAAASRTRVFQYLPYLEAAGIRPTVIPVVPDALLRGRYAGGRARRVLYYGIAVWRTLRVAAACLASARRFDAVFIQRVLFPPPLPRLLGRIRGKVAFDFDDAIYTTDGLAEGILNRLQGWLRRAAVAETLSHVDHAIVENRQNRSYATRYCPGASVITGPIDTDRYMPRCRGTGEGIVLGWVGQPATEPYLDLIGEALSEVGRRYPDVRLLLVGAGRFDVPHMPVERRAWSFASEVNDLREFDIGLMPLPDDAWTRGKGGYKLLQYMALGIPSVASPVGVNAEIVSDGVDGFLAISQDDWIVCLDRLIRDAALRHRMGLAGRGKAERHYSLKVSSVRLVKILRELASPGGGCPA